MSFLGYPDTNLGKGLMTFDFQNSSKKKISDCDLNGMNQAVVMKKYEFDYRDL